MRNTIDLRSKETWPKEGEVIMVMDDEGLYAGFVVDHPELCEDELLVQVCNGPDFIHYYLVDGNVWISVDGITREEITALAGVW